MPNSTWNRRLLRLVHSAGLISAALILTSLATQPQARALEVQGRKLAWSMSVPEGWMGGSYYQIETMLQHTDNALLRNLLRTVQTTARNNEAALIHFEDAYLAAKQDPSFSTRTLTEVTAQFIRNPNESADKTALVWEQFLKSYAVVLETVEYRNAIVGMMSQDSFTVGNRTAHEVAFRVRLPSGGTLYETVIVVLLPSVGQLVFVLTVDSSRHTERRASMKQMVQSLRIP